MVRSLKREPVTMISWSPPLSAGTGCAALVDGVIYGETNKQAFALRPASQPAPRTGEKIQIPASKLPKFRAGKGLKDAIQ